MNVYSCIHDSQKNCTQSKCPSTGKWINKPSHYTCNEILHYNRKEQHEWISKTYNKWKDPDPEGCTLYFPFIWNSRKGDSIIESRSVVAWSQGRNDCKGVWGNFLRWWKCSISLVSMAFRKKTEHSCTLSGVQTELSIILNCWTVRSLRPKTKQKINSRCLEKFI